MQTPVGIEMMDLSTYATVVSKRSSLLPNRSGGITSAFFSFNFALGLIARDTVSSILIAPALLTK